MSSEANAYLYLWFKYASVDLVCLLPPNIANQSVQHYFFTTSLFSVLHCSVCIIAVLNISFVKLFEHHQEKMYTGTSITHICIQSVLRTLNESELVLCTLASLALWISFPLAFRTMEDSALFISFCFCFRIDILLVVVIWICFMCTNVGLLLLFLFASLFLSIDRSVCRSRSSETEVPAERQYNLLILFSAQACC